MLVSCNAGLVFLVATETPTVRQFVVVTTVMFFAAGFSMSGYLSNLIDLAPRHAGALMGISNTVATLPGVFGNLLAGVLLEQTGVIQSGRTRNAIYLHPSSLLLIDALHLRLGRDSQNSTTAHCVSRIAR